MFVIVYSKIIKVNMQKRIPFLDNFNRYRFILNNYEIFCCFDDMLKNANVEKKGIFLEIFKSIFSPPLNKNGIFF